MLNVEHVYLKVSPVDFRMIYLYDHGFGMKAWTAFQLHANFLQLILEKYVVLE